MSTQHRPLCPVQAPPTRLRKAGRCKQLTLAQVRKLAEKKAAEDLEEPRADEELEELEDGWLLPLLTTGSVSQAKYPHPFRLHL